MNVIARLLITTAGLALIPAVSCKEPGPNTDTVGIETPIAELEAEALALAHTAGCSRPDQLRTAPLGTQPCGGPRVYVTYCAATTDSVALFNKLAELKSSRGQVQYGRGFHHDVRVLR